MRTEFRKSFLDDLGDLKDRRLKGRVREVILRVEQAQTLQDVRNVSRLRGVGDYYRVRVGDYRVGLAVRGATVVFVRFLHRREIYRYFP